MTSQRQIWLTRLRRVSAFLLTLAAGAVLNLAVMRAQVINGLRAAGAANAAGWYDRADFLIPYYLGWGGAFLALAVLTALLWAAQRWTAR